MTPRPAIICVGIQTSANLGFIARTMMNFGFRDLFLVAPRCTVDEEAFRTARHAGDILTNARIVSHLAELTDTFHVLVGTTGKPELSTHGPALSPRDVAAKVAGCSRGTRVGLLLGPEDHGLSHEYLQQCRWISRIPTAGDYASLNISHAAAVFMYELAVAADMTPPSGRTTPPCTTAELEQFYAQTREVLLDVGFLHAGNPDRIMYTLRRVFSRAGIQPRELKILRGIARQVGWSLKQAGVRFRK